MRKLIASMGKPKKTIKKQKSATDKEAKAAAKAAAKAEKEAKAAEKAADINKDGKVDEKDLSLVHKAYSAVTKRVRRKKD